MEPMDDDEEYCCGYVLLPLDQESGCTSADAVSLHVASAGRSNGGFSVKLVQEG